MGTHPIFESDFDCLTDIEGKMYRISLRVVRIPVGRRTISDENVVTVESGPNAGYNVRTDFKNRNPRNLEMMNIAHRDHGWAAGAGNRAQRFSKYYQNLHEDKTGMRLAVTNLPARNGYHSVEINRREKFMEGICRHYSGHEIAMVRSDEPEMSKQLLSNTDQGATYFLGLILGSRMQMAGITNCIYPFLPSDHPAELTDHESNFLIGLDETGIILEDELSETSIWNKVKFTERDENETQTYTRGQTPNQIKNNKGSMFD